MFEILFGRLQLLGSSDDGGEGDDYDPEKVTLIGAGANGTSALGSAAEGAHQELVAVPGATAPPGGRQPGATGHVPGRPAPQANASRQPAQPPADAADEWQLN